MEFWQGSLEDMGVISLNCPYRAFWRGKRVLLTGHTGFKGAWLALWLHRMGASVTGFSLPAETHPNLFELAGIAELVDSRIGDIRNPDDIVAVFAGARPEVVFHLAAQALVRPSYRNPLLTYDTNVQGTANLLEAVRVTESAKVVVAITTDKVYQNLENHYPYRESDPVGGYDPYSASKAAAEIVIDSYRNSFLAQQRVALASARAGNVIGGGDWAEDRLIPDAVRAWGSNSMLEIRRPGAIRPWQHVLEPLAGYLVLAEQLWKDSNLAGAYNFGPETHEVFTVREVVEIARAAYGSGDVSWGDGSVGPHEADWLALEVAKARHLLGVSSRWALPQAVQRTMSWYRRLSEGESAYALCGTDIQDYEAATEAGL